MDLGETCDPTTIEYDKGTYSVILLTFLIPDALIPFGVNIIVILDDSTTTLSITSVVRVTDEGESSIGGNFDDGIRGDREDMVKALSCFSRVFVRYE
jgi:hypothetical protein